MVCGDCPFLSLFQWQKKENGDRISSLLFWKETDIVGLFILQRPISTSTCSYIIWNTEEGGKTMRDHENIFKHTSNQANDLVHKTVDTASNILKNTSSFGNDLIGKTVDTTSKAVKGVSNKFKR
jgi:hypothetical protein